MKQIFTVLFTALMLSAQTMRPVVLTWTASTSTGITGYNVSRGTSPSGPFTLLTPTPITVLTYTDSGTVGQTYTYQVVTVAPACTPTTPVTQACGMSAPASASTNVPPPPGITATITVVVP
jgi:hypothetical protein